MQSRFLLVTLFLGLLALVAAAPSIQKRSFKVERVKNPSFTGRNGPQALAKAYRKFGMPLPQGLTKALDAQKTAVKPARRVVPRHRLTNDISVFLNGPKGHQKGDHKKGKGQKQHAMPAGGHNATSQATNQTGSVVATPENNDVEFLSPVNIGGQTLNLDFDTGSSDLWVFNTQLDASITAGHTNFDPKQSKTFSLLRGAQFLVQYGDGSGAEGIVGTDVVDVGGAVFQKQAVQLATAVSDQFVQDQNNDGLMGLAFSKLNTVKPKKQKTFFDNVMGSLSEPVFTVDLKKNATGSYEFGKVDASKFKGDLATIPVNDSQGFWQFSSEKFAVDGGMPHDATKGGQAIADTGTTLILADPAIVQGYYSKVKGAEDNAQAGGITIPCDAKLPDLDLDIGGVYMARVKGEDINFAPVQGNTCFGGLQATNQGGLGVYGDIFFKSQFVVFNGGNKTLQMAEHA
ncbi:Aspartic protease PEP3 [Cladobotryum mycophilum]|uniref:Aspartic protease PEP3 n=1 Tax=Cladobotryum mycophilum TaxID=491253 RepID=A0ABR0SXQ2_9HYPO